MKIIIVGGGNAGVWTALHYAYYTLNNKNIEVELIHDPEIVAHAARIGAECGADIVKTLYTGDIDSFSKVVKSIPVPVVIAGGAKMETDMDVLQMTEDAMKAGAKGVTYGRNIFAHRSPEKIVEALSGIIFKNQTAKEVIDTIDKQ